MTRETVLLYRARLLGDRGAFSALVRLHQGRVRGFLLRLTRRHDVADDLAQDTFLKAFQKLADYSRKGSFTAWLMQIAYSQFLQYRRREKRRDQVGQIYSQDFAVLNSHYMDISSEQIDLERAIMQLPQDEIAVLSLCYSFGLSHQEAAGILDLPMGTVKTHSRRGKDKLRRLLDPNYQQENAS